MKIYPITIPGGSDTQFQYNNGGIFGGVASATYNDATGTILFKPAVDSATMFQVQDKDGNAEFTVDTTNDAILYGYTKLGTIKGSYNNWVGTVLFGGSTPTYTNALGDTLANAATGTVRYLNIIGDNLCDTTTGNIGNANIVGESIAGKGTNVRYDNLVGQYIFDNISGALEYCNVVGQYIAASSSGAIYSNLVGKELGYTHTGALNYNNLVGFKIGGGASTALYMNNMVGYDLAQVATGNIRYNNIIGNVICDDVTTDVEYNNAVGLSIAGAAANVNRNNLVGYNIADASTGTVSYNNIVGGVLANITTGDIQYNNIVGYSVFESATGNIRRNYCVGAYLADDLTGAMSDCFISGYECLKDTTNETDLVSVIAFPYQCLKGSSAADLDYSIAIGYQAGLNNTKTNPALFGHSAVATDHKQIVLGSTYYTGGLRLVSSGSFTLAGAADTDLTINFAGTTTSGVIKWMEDEDYVEFDDDIVFVGDSVGLAYGSCYGNEIAWSQAAAGAGTWYNVSDADMTDGELHRVTHDGSGKLTVALAGRYLINYSVAMASNAASDHVLAGIEISNSGSANAAGQTHWQTKAANSEFALSSTCILDLAASATIEVAVQTADGGSDLSVEHVNITCTQIGGT